VFSPVFSEERNDWISILLNALKSQSFTSQSQAVGAPEKCGYLELRGYKAKIFTVLRGNSVWLCKNEQVSSVALIIKLLFFDYSNNCILFVTVRIFYL
jgi:Arf-GAP/Rho-GAP domain/ANK repeat/PH domain-containing protein 2